MADLDGKMLYLEAFHNFPYILFNFHDSWENTSKQASVTFSIPVLQHAFFCQGK